MSICEETMTEQTDGAGLPASNGSRNPTPDRVALSPSYAEGALFNLNDDEKLSPRTKSPTQSPTVTEIRPSLDIVHEEVGEYTLRSPVLVKQLQ